MPIPTMRLSRHSARTCLAALLLVAGAVAAPACARNQPPQAEDVGAIMLYVENHGWDDMNIFVLRGDTRDRLGRVSAASRWSVPLDRWVRNHTVNRFGPVREVERGFVLEIAFDAAQRSQRHKSGVALRFPRVARLAIVTSGSLRSSEIPPSGASQTLPSDR